MIDSRERYQIVQEEMAKLVKNNFIKHSDYKRVMKAHRKYYQAEEKNLTRSIQIEEQFTQSKPVEVELNQQQQKDPIVSDKLDPSMKISTPKPAQTKQPKKTTEQIRERNITWLLILGVLFLLISGLVVATSTWDQMGALLKVSTLLGVALFFLALSTLSSKILKIKKTAFAFLTLGSLLLPIAIIAIGYFELFGDYLTLTGDGRFWLGLICTLIPLPLYIRNAFQTKTRLFVWISFVFLSFSVGFLLAAINVPVDLFFLLMMLFNAGLLYSYHRLRQEEKHRLVIFIQELPAYAQLNLIVSTFLMLVIFDQSIFYSFNIIITAFLYMAMVFVYQTKEYQLVFIGLFAFGIFQLTENSFLHHADILIYSLLGVAYLGFAHFMRKDKFVSKLFHYSSGFISGIAFLYVIYQGMLIQVEARSWIMLLAYLVITATYVYLAHITKQIAFRWLASVLFMVVGVEFWYLAIQPILPNSFADFMFVYSIALFFGFGFYNRISYLKKIEKSTYSISLIVILLALLPDLALLESVKLSLKLVIIGVLAIYVALHRSDKKEIKIAQWTHAISWLLALYAIFIKITEHSTFYQEQLGFTTHLALAGLVLLVISILWKRKNQLGFTKTAFYTGQSSYLLAIYGLLGSYNVNENFVRPLILLAGIAVTYWLVEYTRKNGFWSLVAFISLSFYLSLFSPFSIESMSSVMWFMLGLPIIFLLVERYFGKYKPGLKPHFFWFAQSILALLVLNIASDHRIGYIYDSNLSNLHPIIWLVPILIYLYTTLTRTRRVEINVALYAALTMIVSFVVSLLAHYELMINLSFIYKWFIAIISLVAIWLAVPTTWKRRVEWYLIPFMNLVLIRAAFVTIPSSGLQLLSWYGLIVLILVSLHYRKWTNYTIIPLLFSVIFLATQNAFQGVFANWLLFITGFVVVVISGNLLFNKILLYNKQGKPTIDWYSLIAILYLIYAYSYAIYFHNIWLEVIVLLAVVGWFLLQSERFSNPLWKNGFITLAGLASLLPYYLILGEYLNYIPELIHAELRVLPILILTIFFTNKIWSRYKPITSHVHTIVLVLITIYLIGDAMESATVWDALILGSLSIISFLVGMRYQLKAYFFVGIATLLFNLIYQTRAYWGNLPWWVYLLLVGILFITIASYNEWKKQKKESGQIEKKLKQALQKFKQWN